MNNTYQEDDKFNKYLSWAFGTHCGVVFFVYIISWIGGLSFFPHRTLPKELIRSSVRVDIVAMPKLTVQELKRMKVSPVASDEVEVTDDGDESSNVDLGNLLSSLSKKKIKRKKKKKVKGKKFDKKALKNLILEGNKVEVGVTAVGDSYAEVQSKFNSYISGLPEYVRPYWKLPSYLLEREGLTCRVKIYINSEGKIINYKIVESSGVDEYDQRAIKAINSLGAFAPPPKEILSKVSSGKVILGFPL